jgi:hypothetical protein
MIKNVDYIVISELPEEEQKPFRKWLVGQTLPLIEEESKNKYNCAYKWDYDKWLSYYRKNQNAPVTD